MALNVMDAEDRETPCGWPFGLSIMNVRLGVSHSLQASRAETRPLRATSSSLSSFPSSYLDTESSASFFQDHSVTLGRLLKIKPTHCHRSNSCLPNSICLEEHERTPQKCLRVDVSSAKSEADMCQGVCIPLLFRLREKLNSSKRVKPTHALEDRKS